MKNEEKKEYIGLWLFYDKEGKFISSCNISENSYKLLSLIKILGQYRSNYKVQIINNFNGSHTYKCQDKSNKYTQLFTLFD